MTNEQVYKRALPLGTKNQMGKIQAVSFKDGERYYMMVGYYGDVALMPASVVEAKSEAKREAKP